MAAEHPRDMGGAPAGPGAGAGQTEAWLCAGLWSPEGRVRSSQPHLKPISRKTAVLSFPEPAPLVPLEPGPGVGLGGPRGLG